MTDPQEKTGRRLALLTLGLWALLAAALALFVHKSNTVQEGAATYLPPTYESQAAQLELRKLFPEQYRPSVAVIVFHRATGLTLDDLGPRVRQFVDWIHRPTLPPTMDPTTAERLRGYLTDAPVRSLATDPLLARRLNSADGQSTLILVGMPDIFTGQSTQQTVAAIREHLRSLDLGGLQVEITGDAGFYSDYAAAAQQSVERSTLVSIALVIVILLVVYRNPLAMFVPLITIAVAVIVAMHVLYLLAPLGFLSDSIIQMFVVVLVFGCGTDYCLFLIARYKEETQSSGTLAGAMRRALAATGTTIVASAMTTICGLSLMSLAIFRAFQKAGPSTAVALVIACAAALTLAPALYLLIGKRIFWPRRKDTVATASPPLIAGCHGCVARQPCSPGTAANNVAVTPGGTAAAAVGVAFADNLWSRIAVWVTRRPGLVAVLVLAVLAGPSLYSFTVRPTHNIFDELSPNWSCVRGFEILKHDYSPGTMGPATLLVESTEPLDSGRGWALLSRLSGELGENKMVAEIVSPRHPGGLGTAVFDSLDDIESERVRSAVEHYFFSADLKAARLEILLREGPYSDNSVAAARELQAIARRVQSAAPFVTLVQLAGPSSTIADITDVSQRDFRVMFVTVLAAVYLILLLLLRRPVLGVFLVFGTLLSFFAALGLADLVFVRLMGAAGLDWKVNFFLFVLLVAVGVDYNIFLGSRIREEMARRPVDEAIRVALARTGGIISACGVIVAGTFASMLAGTLSLTVQLGFALAVGILIDTFLVRPLFVPAVALMLSRISSKRK